MGLFLISPLFCYKKGNLKKNTDLLWTYNQVQKLSKWTLVTAALSNCHFSF